MISRRAVLLVLVVFAHVCDCSLLQNIRKVVGPKDAPLHVSPAPSPNPSVNSDPKIHKFDEGKTIGFLTNERCKTSDFFCHNLDLMACIQSSGGVPEVLWLLVQNGGESMLNVNSTIFPGGVSFNGMKVNKHKAQKVNISEAVGKIRSILITSGNGSCVIHILRAPAMDGNFFQQLSFYTNQLIPIHGIYLLSFTAVAIAILWACCKCRKCERQGDGAPYQELEMAQAGSISSVNVETAEDWDQDWGDGWEKGGVKSSGGNHSGNISSNGLNSRSSSKDGWEGVWND